MTLKEEKLRNLSIDYPKALKPMNLTFDQDYRVGLLRVIHSVTAGIFGRGYNFSVRTMMKIIPNKKMKTFFSDGSVFLFDLNDFYWNKLLLKHYRYEPELEFAFKLLENVDYTFLDCGANIGYWSVLVSSPNFGSKQCIAVEASPETFQKLNDNCQANDSRFKILNNAIYYEDDHIFSMSTAAHHAARQINKEIDTDNTQDSGSVHSITLDSIVSQQNIPNDKKIVIKLDVEGQEINALKGAKQVLKNDFLLAYEDHAKDQDHSVTRYIMETLNLSVFYIDERLTTKEIVNPDELNTIKTGGSSIGYNFFACKKSSFFNKVFNSL